MHCLKYSLKFRSLTNLIFFYLSTQILNFITPLPYHAYANFPHLGKKFCTKKRLIGLVLWVLWYTLWDKLLPSRKRRRGTSDRRTSPRQRVRRNHSLHLQSQQSVSWSCNRWDMFEKKRNKQINYRRNLQRSVLGKLLNSSDIHTSLHPDQQQAFFEGIPVVLHIRVVGSGYVCDMWRLTIVKQRNIYFFIYTVPVPTHSWQC